MREISPIPTYAILIGASACEGSGLPPLPGAANDAAQFAQALVSWGVEKKNLYLQSGKNGDYASVLSTLKGLCSLQEGFKLIFFFSGHGVRHGNESFLLLSDSNHTSSGWEKTLPLDRLIALMGQMNAVESYLFIDACFLRINLLAHPLGGREHFAEKKQVFCLLSAGMGEAYESTGRTCGSFTGLLLETLAEMRHPTVTEFVDMLRVKAAALHLHRPEMYNIDTQSIDLVSALPEGYDPRWKLLQNHLSSSLSFPLGVYGNTRRGKSLFFERLARENFGFLLFSLFPSIKELQQRIELATGLAVEEREIFVFLKKQAPWIVVILDDCSPNSAKEQKLFFELKEAIRVVLVGQSRSSLAERHWFFPEMSTDLKRKHVEKINPDLGEKDVNYLVASASEDLSLLEKRARLLPSFLSRLSGDSRLREIFAALKSCGFTLSKELFYREFGFCQKELEDLVKEGWVQDLGGGFGLHELFYEIYAAKPDLEIRKKAWRYWRVQLKDATVGGASTALVPLLKEFGLDRGIETALQREVHKQKLFACELADLLLEWKYTGELSLATAKALLKLPSGWEKALHLAYLPFPGPIQKKRAKEIGAEVERSLGLWKRALANYTGLVERKGFFSLPLKESFALGCTLFCGGELAGASERFRKLSKTAKDRRLRGLSLCMLGTCLGWSEQMESSQAIFEEGIAELQMLKDSSALWVGYNNLAEIFLLNGKFEEAREFLQKARSIAEGRKEQVLETQRILLELSIREGRLEAMDELKCLSESAFLRNSTRLTLASFHIFQGKPTKAKECLRQTTFREEGAEFLTPFLMAISGACAYLEDAEREAEILFQQASEVFHAQGNRLGCKLVNSHYKRLGDLKRGYARW